MDFVNNSYYIIIAFILTIILFFIFLDTLTNFITFYYWNF
jgi:hypothetical protein